MKENISRLPILIGILAIFMVSMPVAGASTMFRADPQHTGVYDDGGTRPNNVLKWSYTGFLVTSSPAVANDIVYVGIGRYIHAINAMAGVDLWVTSTGGFIGSSPAVVNGIVYVGSEDDKVYALNATTGVKLWDYTTGGYVWSSPAVVNGVVYVGSNDYKVYALNATTGVKLWEYLTGFVVQSSPAVSKGIVYVGSGDGNVYALDATTGVKIWNYTTGSGVVSSPAVASGVVYVGNLDNKVYALNAATGAKLWDYNMGLWESGVISTTSSPAVASGVVYVGSLNDKVYALNASSGAKLWDYTTGDRVESSPAVSNGVVYVGSNDNEQYALNAATGTKLWNYKTENAVISSPAVANGVVYVGSLDGNVYAIGSPTPSPSPYSLQLNQGWNFISTPKILAPGYNTGSIFSNVDMGGHSAFMWDTSQNPSVWTPVLSNTPIQPLYGIWIYSVSSTVVNLTFDQNSMNTPPSRSLPAGWISVGFTGLTPTSARNTYLSVQPSWTTSMGFDASTQSYQPTIFNGDTSESTLLYPTKGYWLYMRTPGNLAAIGA